MTYRNRNIRNRQARRGVTLLLVLGLMTMFAMLVVTFMVVTTQAMRTSQSVAKVALKYSVETKLIAPAAAATTPTPDFDLAIDKLLVGDKLETVIGPYSILENLYGHPNYIDSSNNETENLQADVTVTGSAPLFNVTLDLSDGNHQLSTSVDLFDYIGGVLTVGNKSAIITSVTQNGTDLELEVFPVDGATGFSGSTGTAYINTRAFGGTGPGYYRPVTGYNDGDPLLILRDVDIDDTDGSISIDSNPGGFELALRPNALAPESDGTQPHKEYLEHNPVLMNPDYTAPDYQNMFLAWSEVATDNTGGGGTTSDYYIQSVIPSFHRPSLVKYWDHGGKLNDGTNDVEDLRKIVLRPLKQDHPDFTGSNPAANVSSLTDEVDFLINGPWDVDNDGDGIQDGIWLDLGAAPQSINGKSYKPLYSFYVLDMDGRLNVNVHGMDTTLPPGSGSGTVDGETGGLTDTYGSGTGVAEIRLGEGLAMISGSGGISNLLKAPDGRYGSDNVPGAEVQDAALISTLGQTMGVWHGAYATPEDGDYTGFGGILPDFSSKGAIEFDPLGNRIFDHDGPFFAQSPYMMNPYYKDSPADDSPFKVEDLEFLIRSVGDMSFREVLSETRLRYLFDSDDGANDVEKFSKYRHFVTTQSTDIPAAANAGLGGYKGIFEYLIYKIFGYDNNEDDTHSANVEAKQKAGALAKLLPPELLRGEKMSLDRIMHLEASVTDKTQLLREKSRFAQEMFYLILVLCPEITADDIARVAQWCVNLVDFLDADDAMTPLVFHETDPLNNASTTNDFTSETNFGNFYGGSYTVNSGYRLIWGMEQPEVALTKTFATHNLRIADSKFGYDVEEVDTSEANVDIRKELIHNCDLCGIHINRVAKNCDCTEDPAVMHKHDTSYDQVMIPQGSLFLELYRVGNPNRTTSSLYDANGRLDLAKNNENNTGTHPIWRLAISEPTKTDAGNDYTLGDGDAAKGELNDVFATAIKKDGDVDNAKSYTFQPQQWPTSTGDGSCDVKLERFIWFGSTVPTEADNADYNFTNFGSPGEVDESSTVIQAGNPGLTNAALEPNEHLVIGPRSFTSFKSKEFEDEDETFGEPTMEPGSFIDLRKLNPSFKDDDAVEAGDSSFKSPKVMVAGAYPAWSAGKLGPGLSTGIGVNVSEPKFGDETYYDLPTGTAAAEMKKQMGLEAETFSDSYIDDPDLCKTISDKEEDFVKKSGTITRFRSVFLQRLADPDRPYNETTNPYITVDWNMIDLHIFNSEQDSESGEPTPIAEGSSLEFAIRQWNCAVKDGATITSNRPNIWDRTFKAANDMDPSGEGSDKLKEGIYFGRYSFEKADLHANLPDNLKRLMRGELNGLSDKYIGSPKIAFLHFPWNNGPLSNTYELMLVPASSPSRFGFEFATPPTASAREWWKTDDDAMALEAAPSLGMGDPSASPNPTKHMPICNPGCYVGPYFNFFNNDIGQPKLSRLFDFVRVPSKFNGSVQGIDADGKPVYRMREPGKINLNTVNEATWEALRMDDSSFPAYTEFRDTILGTSSNLPTKFPFPIRPSTSGNLVPINDLQFSGIPTVFRDVTRTLSVADPEIPGSTDETATGLMFSPHDPDFGFTNPEKGTNQRTALENAMRRSDMITNRSNVFAVWVTIGYFEVKKYDANGTSIQQLWDDHSTVKENFPDTNAGHTDNINFFNAVYPDGYVLGAEKGLSDGSVTRHRYFYLIDRSVPVGFRRGEKLNSENVIIEKRRLE